MEVESNTLGLDYHYFIHFGSVAAGEFPLTALTVGFGSELVPGNEPYPIPRFRTRSTSTE